MNDEKQPAMERDGGRAFQVKGRAVAKTLRQENPGVFEKQEKASVVEMSWGEGGRVQGWGQDPSLVRPCGPR